MPYYTLRRMSDGCGDSGAMSLAIWMDENNEVIKEHDARPQIGKCICVGSYAGRSYQWQDWWRTSSIVEILTDEENLVVFKTQNSTYEWTCQSSGFSKGVGRCHQRRQRFYLNHSLDLFRSC
jgi:hypothetical protein